MRLLHIMIVCLITAVALSACGRRGGLERPAVAGETPPEATAGQPAQHPDARKEKEADRPFILDGLL